MKIERLKLEMAMARACMNADDLSVVAGMPRPTLNNAITGRGISPKTAGKIARALNVDISELMDMQYEVAQKVAVVGQNGGEMNCV